VGRKMSEVKKDLLKDEEFRSAYVVPERYFDYTTISYSCTHFYKQRIYVRYVVIDGLDTIIASY
jgi:hypothetical protein